MDNLATEVLHEVKRSSKRWYIAFLIVLACWLATIGGFLWYLTLPVDCCVEEYSQDADNQSINEFIKGDYYGSETKLHENDN